MHRNWSSVSPGLEEILSEQPYICSELLYSSLRPSKLRMTILASDVLVGVEIGGVDAESNKDVRDGGMQ